MKFPANVGVVKSSAVKIRRMESCMRGKTAKKRDPMPGRFATKMSEIKAAVLRDGECFHK